MRTFTGIMAIVCFILAAIIGVVSDKHMHVFELNVYGFLLIIISILYDIKEGK